MLAYSEIAYLSIADLHRLYLSGELSPVDVIEASLRRIEEKDPAINAFVTVTADIARRAAREAEAKIKSYDGKLPRLFGVPLGLKDLSDSIAGVRNTYGSRAFSDFIAPKTAEHVQRLLDAGAIVVGKTNTSEFGHKNTTDNEVVGPTSSPFAIGYNAGGSSGGSAAAVAAGMATIALGSDGGGSIRVPAACCGVFGFKPTFGQAPWTNRPNAFGTLAPYTHKGPLTRTVADAIAMYDVEGQPYSKDPFGPSYARPSFEAALSGSLKGKRVAFVPALCGLAPEADVLARVSAAADAFRAAGAEVVEMDDPLGFCHADVERIWYGLFYVFSADTAEGLKGIGFDINSPSRGLLSETFLELVDKGTRMTALEFQRLNHERTKVLDAVDTVFETYDYLITPTNLAAGVPNSPEMGNTFGPSAINSKPVSQTMGWSLTYLFNLTGHPIASVPVGLTEKGHPVGMQIVGPRHGDFSVLSASAEFERTMPWAATYQALK